MKTEQALLSKSGYPNGWAMGRTILQRSWWRQQILLDVGPSGRTTHLDDRVANINIINKSFSPVLVTSSSFSKQTGAVGYLLERTGGGRSHIRPQSALTGDQCLKSETVPDHEFLLSSVSTTFREPSIFSPISRTSSLVPTYPSRNNFAID